MISSTDSLSGRSDLFASTRRGIPARVMPELPPGRGVSWVWAGLRRVCRDVRLSWRRAGAEASTMKLKCRACGC